MKLRRMDYFGIVVMAWFMISLAIIPAKIVMKAFGATVVQIKVDTGNSALDQKINNFYKCVSDTGKDPPTLKVTDDCFTQNVNHGFISTFIPAFRLHFHHFSTQPRSDILSSFNHHKNHRHFFFGHTVIIHIPHVEVIHRN